MDEMTLEDRIRGFQAGLEQLQQRYGMRLSIQAQPEQLGEAILVKPMLQVVPMTDWQPGEPAQMKSAKPRDNQEKESK